MLKKKEKEKKLGNYSQVRLSQVKTSLMHRHKTQTTERAESPVIICH